MQSFATKLLVDAVFMEQIKVQTNTFYALAELVYKLTSYRVYMEVYQAF